MQNNNVNLVRLAAVAALASAALSAQAQVAGSWMISGAVTHIAPNTSSGTLSPPAPPGTTVDIGADTQPTLSVAYMLTDSWSLELPIGFGFKHEIKGNGAITGTGTLGTTHALPVSLFAQYRFLEPSSAWRPYLMLGITYAYFYDEQGSATLSALNPLNPPGGTSINVDSRWGITPGFGVTVRFAEKWFVDLQYAHSFLTTTTTLNSGQSIKTKLDPDVYKIGVGMIF